MIFYQRLFCCTCISIHVGAVHIRIFFLIFRLARFDGVEFTAGFLGTLLSPHIFKVGGYYALYLVRLSFVGVALVYWLKIIKSPEELGIVKEGDGQCGTAMKEMPQNSPKSKVMYSTWDYGH